MLPFDRLIKAADDWTEATGATVFAQVGNGKYKPKHMEFAGMMAPEQFNIMLRSASLIVAHAGMGSVISAMEAGKPIVVLPRRAADREVTTDHQIHTANWLRSKPGVFVADTEADVAREIDKAIAASPDMKERLSDMAPPPLIARIKSFLAQP
jgi:UDP-N-acetylglucosamine transferase subunit ALG13